MNSIAVVYLARYAEGPDPVREFVASWKRHPPGVPCDLIVVWKGFPELDHSGSEQARILSELDHSSLTMSDEGFDLTAYNLAALPRHASPLSALELCGDDNGPQWPVP